MDPTDLIKLLKASADQGDLLIQRLIEELTERGAILDDIERLQRHQISHQASAASIITEAAFIAQDLRCGGNHRLALLGRKAGGLQ